MRRSHFFFRGFLTGATASFGTRIDARMRVSNFVNPLGLFFLASMLTSSLQAHESAPVDFAQLPVGRDAT